MKSALLGAGLGVLAVTLPATGGGAGPAAVRAGQDASVTLRTEDDDGGSAIVATHEAEVMADIAADDPTNVEITPQGGGTITGSNGSDVRLIAPAADSMTLADLMAAVRGRVESRGDRQVLGEPHRLAPRARRPPRVRSEAAEPGSEERRRRDLRGRADGEAAGSAAARGLGAEHGPRPLPAEERAAADVGGAACEPRSSSGTTSACPTWPTRPPRRSAASGG